MTGKRKITATIVSVILAAIVVVSSAFMLSGVKANAASYEGSAQAHWAQKSETVVIADKTVNLNEVAKAYVFRAGGKTSYGYDWTYTTDNNNVKVKCKYDFTAHKYTFKITGTSRGTNHLVLKYKTADKKWTNVKMTLVVNNNSNIMRTA